MNRTSILEPAVTDTGDGQTASRDALRKRALIVKFGAIGDVMMVIPGAAALHAEGFAIDWVASELIAPVLRLYPWIYIIDVDEPNLLQGSYAVRLRTWFRLWRALRARVSAHGAYTTLATLYYDRRYSWLTALIPAKRKVSLSRTDRRFALLPGRHHTDEYARILCDRLDAATPFQLAPVRPAGMRQPPRVVDPDRPKIVLVPAGARNVLRDDALRRWPIENYVLLASELLQGGHEVLLVGGPDDGWASPYFEALGKEFGATRLRDRIGSLSLVETLDLLNSAAVTVTHDTGPLHLAGVTSSAIVTIFGPTDPHGRLPRRSNTVALWGGEGFACRPCYDGRHYAPCPDNACMAQITPAMVLTQIQTLIEARARNRSLPPRVLLPEPAPFVSVQDLR